MKDPVIRLPNFDDTRSVFRYGKIIIFLLLATVCIILTANNWNTRPYAEIPAWFVVLPAVLAFLTENAVKMWAVKSDPAKIACYVIDILLLLTLTIFTDGALISTLYLLILSEFYLSQKTLMGSIIMCGTSIGLYLVTFTVSGVLKEADFNVVSLVSNAFNDLILLLMHFFVFNLSIQIYRKNREITQMLAELTSSNEKLRVANEELKEIAVLEERQRIAKDIHDTAGHSITTVIMQTEAAKLVVESDPADAKRKITAANLQAKHALEELRESVHLLSGATERETLRELLIGIIQDSTDGTGIAVRYEIEDIVLCDAKRRFFCNALKEGIANGLRHGGATAFWFELKREGTRIEFLLSDNGQGAELGSFTEGFGLTGMHKRAEELGGTVWFTTEPDEGFEVHIILPVDGAKGERT